LATELTVVRIHSAPRPAAAPRMLTTDAGSMKPADTPLAQEVRALQLLCCFIAASLWGPLLGVLIGTAGGQVLACRVGPGGAEAREVAYLLYASWSSALTRFREFAASVRVSAIERQIPEQVESWRGSAASLLRAVWAEVRELDQQAGVSAKAFEVLGRLWQRVADLSEQYGMSERLRTIWISWGMQRRLDTFQARVEARCARESAAM
jgi:hypothetical protein